MANENVLRGVSYPLQGRVRPSPFDTKERIRRLGCWMDVAWNTRQLMNRAQPGYLRHT